MKSVPARPQPSARDFGLDPGQQTLNTKGAGLHGCAGPLARSACPLIGNPVGNLVHAALKLLQLPGFEARAHDAQTVADAGADLTVEGAIRHGPDRLAEGYDDLIEGAERPELERPLSRGGGSAAPRGGCVAFVCTLKFLLEIFAHILPPNRIYLRRWRTKACYRTKSKPL
jgi:hypothetical protein